MISVNFWSDYDVYISFFVNQKMILRRIQDCFSIDKDEELLGDIKSPNRGGRLGLGGVNIQANCTQHS